MPTLDATDIYLLLSNPSMAEQYAGTNAADDIAAAVVDSLPKPSDLDPADKKADDGARWLACGEVLARLVTATSSSRFFEITGRWTQARPAGPYGTQISSFVVEAFQPRVQAQIAAARAMGEPHTGAPAAIGDLLTDTGSGLTAGQLKALLKNVPDDLPLTSDDPSEGLRTRLYQVEVSDDGIKFTTVQSNDHSALISGTMVFRDGLLYTQETEGGCIHCGGEVILTAQGTWKHTVNQSTTCPTS